LEGERESAFLGFTRSHEAAADLVDVVAEDGIVNNFHSCPDLRGVFLAELNVLLLGEQVEARMELGRALGRAQAGNQKQENCRRRDFVHTTLFPGATSQAPPPTKCTISSRSPSARLVLVHWSRGTRSRFSSTATRSDFIFRRASKPARLSGPSSVRSSPLITSFIITIFASGVGWMQVRSGRSGRKAGPSKSAPHRRYSTLRRRNLRVAERSPTRACTNIEESGKADSSSSTLISALPSALVAT